MAGCSDDAVTAKDLEIRRSRL